MILETMIVGPLEVNCYLLAQAPKHDAVVIDPGGDGEMILRKLQEHRVNLKYILNTHGHFDHVGANELLKKATGAKILIHAKDAPLLTAADKHARFFGMMVKPSPPADETFAHGDQITVGDYRLQVLSTPGHSDGGVCFAMDRLLFTGDTLFAGSIGRTDLPGGSFREIMISIQEKILPLGNHITIYPGHGPRSTLAKEKQTNPFLLELGKGPF